MFELLFLLLPIAAVYGYYMGRSASKQKQSEQQNSQSTTYLKGFDYLLSNKHEKAVDKFIDYLNGKDLTFDTTIALGKLLRKRGEADKAITLHERLSLDKDLDESSRQLSLLELSRDFISAGLLDRAENVLYQLTEIPAQRKDAAKLLLNIYEKEQDYTKAITIYDSFKDSLGHSVDKLLCQYHCEEAKRLFLQKNEAQAIEHCKKAIEFDNNSIRARLELAEIYISQKKFTEAYKFVKEASIADPNSGLICLNTLKKCFPNLADPNYRFALEDLVNRTNSAQAMVELVKVVDKSSGREDAIALLDNFLKTKNSLKLFSIFLQLKNQNESGNNEAITQIKSYVDAQLSRDNHYFCPNCGFESRMLFWQCPSCRKWESLKPKTGLDGD